MFVFGAIDGEAIARAVQQGADEQLGLGVFTPHPAHLFRAFFWRQIVHTETFGPADPGFKC